MVRAFFGRLSDTFGWTFVALLISAYLGVKGSLMQLTTSAQLPYFKKNLGITGTEYQAYGTAAMTPWAMKALIGTISDAVPLFGYHKRNYILLAALGGSFAYVFLATLHIEPSGAALAAFLLFCAQLELATVDLLVEGTYARVCADGTAGFGWGRGRGESACGVACVQDARLLCGCLSRDVDSVCGVLRLLWSMARPHGLTLPPLAHTDDGAPSRNGSGPCLGCLGPEHGGLFYGVSGCGRHR